MKKEILTLREVLKVALFSYDVTLIKFNKDYTSLTIKDIENEDDKLSDSFIKNISLNNYLLIDKSEYTTKEIVSIVKDFYINNIKYNQLLNKIKLENKLIKQYSKDISNYLNLNNYARVLVSKDYNDFVIFNFNERYLDESMYTYELIINNKRELWTKKEIKEQIKEFFNNRKYFIKE